jgi:hypothetical protein
LTTRISETNSVLSALDATINGLRRSIQTVTLTSRAGADWALQNVLSQVKSGKSITDFADTISGASSVLGQDSSRLYATFADYARAQAKSADILAQIKAAGGAQLTSAEQLLKSIEDGFKAEMAALDQIVIDAQTQINVLLGINTSVLSVAAAVIAVNASIAGLASATATLKSVKSGAGIAQPGMSTDETFVTSLYNRLLGRAPDAAGLAGWTAQLAAGASPTSIIAGFTGSQEYMGSHADGLDMVPFDGYVAQLHSGERIKTAAASRQEDAVASEIRSMRVELNSALVAIALNTGDTAKRNRKWDGEGLPATRT